MTEDEYHSEMQALRNELAELRRGAMRVAEPDTPKRVTQTEMLRALLDRMRSQAGERTTVRLTRNSKGDTQIEVYCEAETGETLAEAAIKAQATYDVLRAQYPLSHGGQE